MRLIRVLCETKLLTTRGSHKRRVTLSVVDETRLMRVVCHDTDRGFSDTAGAKPKSSPSPPVSTKLSQLVSLDACRLESTNESSQTWWGVGSNCSFYKSLLFSYSTILTDLCHFTTPAELLLWALCDMLPFRFESGSTIPKRREINPLKAESCVRLSFLDGWCVGEDETHNA